MNRINRNRYPQHRLHQTLLRIGLLDAEMREEIQRMIKDIRHDLYKGGSAPSSPADRNWQVALTAHAVLKRCPSAKIKDAVVAAAPWAPLKTRETIGRYVRQLDKGSTNKAVEVRGWDLEVAMVDWARSNLKPRKKNGKK